VRAPRVAALSLLLAALAGAAFAGDDGRTAGQRRIDCEDRCEERFAECESEAETKADECARKVSDDPAWIACECEENGAPTKHCEPVCEKGDKAAEKCEAKLEKAVERCEEKAELCADRCDD
jgi:hypothetical protein